VTYVFCIHGFRWISNLALFLMEEMASRCNILLRSTVLWPHCFQNCAL
jgi:hypothetical protein